MRIYQNSIERFHVIFIQFPPMVTFCIIVIDRILAMSPQDSHLLIIQTLIQVLLRRKYADVIKFMDLKIGTLILDCQGGHNLIT